jgi:steroid 5-alpha reductase family enzyme
MPYSLLALNAAALVGVLSLAFVLARRRNRLDTVDIAWGLGFIVVAWIAYAWQPGATSLLIASLVTVWGTRLAWHIYRRSRGKGEDRRYTELSSKWGQNFWLRAYVSVFLLQALLIWVVSVPISLATTIDDTTGWLLLVGGSVWLLGFACESVGDRQLATYLRQKNRPPVLQTGLWRYSRHPNYFGELVQWWAIAVLALPASFGWLGLFGPLTLTLLIVCISGIPPIEKRRATDAAYRDYQKRTSVLVPLPPKKIST